jgi:hypothetical protein
VTSCRTIRPRPAPSAARTASSVCRPDAREQQTRDVHARDEQQHADCRHQHEQRCLHLADDGVADRRRVDRRRPRALGEFARKTFGNARHLASELRFRRAVLQPGNHGEEPRATPSPDLVRSEVREGNPDIDPAAGRIRERRRHDADDLERLLVQRDRPAHDRWIRAETARPETVTDHRHPVAPEHVVGGNQRPSQQRQRAECLEEAVRDERGCQPLRVADPRQIHARHAVHVPEAAHRVGCLDGALPVEEVWL